MHFTDNRNEPDMTDENSDQLWKLKSHKSPGIDEIPAELIKVGVEQFAGRFVSLSLLFGRRRNCLKSGRSRS